MYKKFVNICLFLVVAYILLVIARDKIIDNNSEDQVKEISQVNIYSSRKEELIKDLFTEFTAKENIKVNLLS